MLPCATSLFSGLIKQETEEINNCVSVMPKNLGLLQSDSSSMSNYCYKPLPINLSTLLPVSKNNLQDVMVSNSDISPPTWQQVQSGSLNIPGLVFSNHNSSCSDLFDHSFKKQKLTLPFSTWPGVEAVIEAYKKHHKGKFLSHINSLLSSFALT